MNASPLVMSVVLAWAENQDTEECLCSLRNAGYASHRIVLVDNGSSDDFIRLVQQRFPEVHLIRNGRNLGFAEGNNVGIRYALAQGAVYIFLANNDIAVPEDTLGQLVQIAEADAQLGIVCPRIVSYFDRRREYIGAQIDWQTGQCGDIERPAREMPAMLDTSYAPGCALLIKSQVIRQIGLLDSNYFAYYEDADWSLRCQSAGYRVVVAPQPAIYHKGTLDQIQRKSAEAFFYGCRNNLLFMRRYAAPAQWRVFRRRYSAQCLALYRYFYRQGEYGKATAALDGWWAGRVGQAGPERTYAPRWLALIVQSRFFQDYLAPLLTLVVGRE